MLEPGVGEVSQHGGFPRLLHGERMVRTPPTLGLGCVAFRADLAADEFCGNMLKVRATVPLFQLFQNCVIHRLDCADYEEASSVAKYRQKVFVFSQVLDLDGDVVRSARKFTVELFHQLHGVADPVEKIRISKRDMFCARSNLLTNVLEHNLALLAGAMVLVSSNAFGQAETQPYFTEPALSPDGAEIAFVSGGDIWTVPAGGGDARLLVSHAANESRPLYSPDGRRLAFNSARTGNGDIYLLTIETGDLKRLTFDDSNEQLDAWSADGRWIYFTSNSRDISGTTDIYRISSEGGTPMQVSADLYTNEYFGAPSPETDNRFPTCSGGRRTARSRRRPAAPRRR